MCSGSQPSTSVDGTAVVVALAQVGLTRVQCHPYAQRRRRRPGLGMQCLLERRSSGDGIRSTGKHGEAAVTLATRPHDLSVMLGDDLLHQRIVPDECLAHCIAVLLPERGA